MTRPIKFRAWDKQFGEMIYRESNLTFFEDVAGDDVVIMQFTGLLDKNGKEIYEGDIIEINRCGEPRSKLVVVFEEGAFWAGNKFDGYRLYADSDAVFGNIYENPELVGNK